MATWRRISYLAAAALVPLAAACDEDTPTDPGEEVAMATVTGVVHDSAAVLPEGRDTMAPTDSTDYDGVVTGAAEIEIYSEAEGWTSLGAETEVTFEAYCEEASVVHEAASVEATTYSRVRITLSAFEVSVVEGAVVEGLVYADPFAVALGAGDPVVVEIEVSPFTLAEDESVTILIDLNTEVWLDEETITSGLVADSEVQAAATAFVR